MKSGILPKNFQYRLIKNTRAFSVLSHIFTDLQSELLALAVCFTWIKFSELFTSAVTTFLYPVGMAFSTDWIAF